MRATVVVPTYRRSADLTRCLAAIRLQTRAPDAVIVTVRADDADSAAVVSALSPSWPALKHVTVARPGVVAAMNAALDAAGGDVLAFTDDDAEPEAEWLERLLAVFEMDPCVAGVGGRDVQEGADPRASDVGRLQWFGRTIGNHHVGIGSARHVDVLKGVCCAFRLSPLRDIRFDERLRGTGAQVHWELALCLSMRRKGWILVYDPAIRVLHHVGARHDADQLHRGRFDVEPHENAVFNETLAIAEHLPMLHRAVFRVWSLLVGTAAEPGVLQVPRIALREGRTSLTRFAATQGARAQGFRAAHRDERVDG
ncbi:MAG TPA: glycosyltransferase [Gemmatimonadaceae bacterium]